jgi:hypothetical protein|tara:strand:- start:1167 stop:1733 length:567 start_codon:yes stop_codon:yes gene_type:complete
MGADDENEKNCESFKIWFFLKYTMDKLLKEINKFLGEASLKTYAGGGAGVDPENAEAGMQELEWGDKNEEWYYKDSYAGFFQSWGREIIWHNKIPVWCQIYGGGMEPEYHKDIEFTHKTFGFLKKAMSSGDKVNKFQPRGPKVFKDGDWKYASKMKGDIKKFEGSEKITYKGKIVFTHDFHGGLFVCK